MSARSIETQELMRRFLAPLETYPKKPFYGHCNQNGEKKKKVYYARLHSRMAAAFLWSANLRTFANFYAE